MRGGVREVIVTVNARHGRGWSVGTPCPTALSSPRGQGVDTILCDSTLQQV